MYVFMWNSASLQECLLIVLTLPVLTGIFSQSLSACLCDFDYEHQSSQQQQINALGNYSRNIAGSQRSRVRADNVLTVKSKTACATFC